MASGGPDPDRANAGGPGHAPGALISALAAIGVLLVVAPRVAGFTTDSDAYLDVALNLGAGLGLVQQVVDFWRPTIPDPLGMWPPLYPLVIAATSVLGVPLEAAARLIPAASFLGFALAFHALARRAAGPWAGLVATLLALSTIAVARCGATAWSEMPWLLLITAGMLGLARLADPAGPPAAAGTMIRTGLAFGLAALVRYAGVPIALLATIAVATMPAARRRLPLFALAALAPPAAWLARNQFVFGHPSGPGLPDSDRTLAGSAFELVRAVRWEWLPEPIARSAVLAVPALAALVVAMAWALRRGGAARLGAGFALAHAVLVIVTTAGLSINSPGGRYLAPALPFLWLVLAAAVAAARRTVAPPLRIVFAVVIVATFALRAWDLNRFVLTHDAPAAANAQRRGELAELAGLVTPGTGPVLSDAGHRVRLATGRPAVQIPPADFRPRPYGPDDDARWRTAGVRDAVLRRPAASPAPGWTAADSTAHFVRFTRTGAAD